LEKKLLLSQATQRRSVPIKIGRIEKKDERLKINRRIRQKKGIFLFLKLNGILFFFLHMICFQVFFQLFIL